MTYRYQNIELRFKLKYMTSDFSPQLHFLHCKCRIPSFIAPAEFGI